MRETITLSARERAILTSYSHMIEGLAAYLGSGYELVLHNLESFEHSVIKIINGFHTGRSEGAPITDLALSMLGRLEEQPGLPRAIVYLTRNRKGEPLKSTTIPILGENERIIGLLCINLYLNTPLSDFFDLQIDRLGNTPQLAQHETFADDTDELIAHALADIVPAVRMDPSISAKEKNKTIIRRLAERGVFSLKGSVEAVSEQLMLSPNTVYLHLRSHKEAKPETKPEAGQEGAGA